MEKEKEVGKEIQTKDEKQFASGRELLITEVKFKQDKEGNLKKATLLTSKGQKITYSGKEYTTEVTELNGIPVEQDVTKPITMAEVPEKLKKIFEIKAVIDIKQQCKVKLSYHIWNKDIDGEIESYRYIQKKQYEEMEIIDSSEVEVVPVE